MAIDGRLNFDTKISTKGFSKGLRSLKDQLSGLTSTIFKIGAALGLAFGTKEVIESAASVNAAASQLIQTFGDLQTEAKNSMQKVADSSGIVTSRLQEVGTSIYAFAKTAGMDSATALNMMQEALQVTADQAAYYDRSLEDTADSLKSFLKGNYENDAALGISCTETTRNTAANKLYGKSFADLSEAQKQLTLLQMVKDANALSGAEGQAAREADGWENVVGNLKETWRQLLAVIGQPVLSAAVNVVKGMTVELQKLTSVARSAVSALSDVFGIKLENISNSVADSSSKASDNYSDMAESAKEAAEAQENSLASFDQINKLNDDSKSSSSNSGSDLATGNINRTISVSADIDTSAADKKMTKFFKQLKSSFSKAFEPFKQAWDQKGSKVIDSIIKSFKSIGGLISAIGISFATVWTNGTGEKIVEHILDIFININKTIKNIANNLKKAWTTDNLGTDIVQHAADIWDTILTHVKKITDKISNWSTAIDFQPLFKSFDELETALKPFADTIGAGLEDFFDEVLLPLASWTITDLIPTFLSALSDVIDGLTAAWNTAYPVLKEKLWDKFLQPIAKWAGEKVIKLLNIFGSVIKKLGESITEKEVDVLIDLAGAIGSIYLAVKGKKKIDEFNKSLQTMKVNAKDAYNQLKKIWAIAKTPLNTSKTKTTSTAIIPAGTATSAATAGTTAGVSFATKFFAAIGSFLVGWSIGSMIRDAIGGDKIDEFLFPVFDKIVAFFQDFADSWSVGWETIKSGWNDFWDSVYIGWDTIASFFTETIPAFFSGLWEDIKSVFSSVGDFFTEKYNDITGAFSSIGTWFGEKFSAAWSAIKKPFISIGTWFSDRWQDIKDVFKTVKAFFSSKFTSAWNAIKKPFEAVGEFFGGVWDSMTDGLKGAVNAVIDGLNWMIGGLNSISFDMPDWDWLPDSVQGSSFGINIPEIPKLAQGAVIPPNSEFLAILGDQKRGTNIEAPLDTITQAVMQALVAYGGTGGNGNQKVSVTIPVTLNGRVITQIVIDNINDLIKCNGKSPIIA